MAAIVREDYGFRPRVIDLGDSNPESGVRVYVFDNDDDLAVDGDSIQTNGSGQITEQFLINQIRTDTGTGFAQNLETPHNVVLTKYTGTFGIEIVSLQTSISADGAPDLFVRQNTNITLNETAVSGFLGININDGTRAVTVSQSRTVNELYHFAFREATINPEPDDDFRQILSTVDGNNYSSTYDLEVSAGILDFEGNSIGLPDTPVQRTFTISGTGTIDNAVINGLVILENDVTLSNVTINGDLQINTGANSTINFNNVTVTGDVTNTSGNTLSIIPDSNTSISTSEPGTGTGQVDIQAIQITLTLTGLEALSEVRIYAANTQTELDGVENSGTTFAFQYAFVPSTFVDIVVFNVQFDPLFLEDIELGPADASLPIQQIFDRWYSNP